MDAVLKSRIYLIATTAFCSIIYATVVEASADTYLGCYDESGTDQVFDRASAIKITDLPSSGPDGCRERCRRNLTNYYSFAGLWGGTHCYCARSLIQGQVTQVSNSVCFAPCPGAPAEYCGGSNASTSTIFSVYSVCSKEMYGRNCGKNCNCKENRNCTVNGVCQNDECAVGWKLSHINMNRRTCSVDINECETECKSTNSINCHNCSIALHQQCNNTNGSFECICDIGFRKVSHGTCTDVNECDVGNGGCQYYCNNTDGSFVCSCGPRYRISVRIGESYNCTDVDECAEGTSGCDHNCNNTDGGYKCNCHSGYQLNSDQKKCIDVDECMYDTHNCNQICNNELGSYSCSCHAGFYLIGAFDCLKDSSSIILGLGIGNGIQSFIIVFLVATGVVLLMLMKRKWTEKAKTREQGGHLHAGNGYRVQ